MELTQLLASSRGGVATDFSLVTATGVLQPRAIYHSNRLVRRILIRPLRNVAAPGWSAIHLFPLLRAIVMPPLRAIQHLIRLVWRIQMRALRTQSDCWLWSKLNFW